MPLPFNEGILAMKIAGYSDSIVSFRYKIVLGQCKRLNRNDKVLIMYLNKLCFRDLI